MSELMVKILYPASDAIFYVTTRTPSTDAEWNVLQGQALMVAESANLLMMPAHMRDEDRWLADAKLMRDAGLAAFKAAKAKDVKALVKFSGDKKYDFRILKAVDQVNDYQKRVLVRKMDAHFGSSLKAKTIAVWGLAFKPETDDMRDAPSIPIVARLAGDGAAIRAFDPEAMAECRRLYGERDDLMLAGDRIQAVKGADALVIEGSEAGGHIGPVSTGVLAQEFLPALAAEHLVFELFKRRVGIEVQHIAYRGGAQVFTDLIGGQVLAPLARMTRRIPTAKTRTTICMTPK